MLDKMKKIFELQGKISQIKKELENSIIEVTNQNQDIKIAITGEQKVLSLDIADSLIGAQNKEQFKRDLLDCFNQAIKKSQALASQKAKEITGLNIPGF